MIVVECTLHLPSLTSISHFHLSLLSHFFLTSLSLLSHFSLTSELRVPWSNACDFLADGVVAEVLVVVSNISMRWLRFSGLQWP